MLTAIHPKLPMRNKLRTRCYYQQLGFQNLGAQDYEDYLMINRDDIEIHFFMFQSLDPLKNYGQVYIRTNNIDQLYRSLIHKHVSIHPNGTLTIKPWGMKEFSLLDPDHNLLTFGEHI